MGKPVPRYWWDFDGENGIKVESDIPGKFVIATYAYTDDAEAAIALAQKHIADLNAGRRNSHE